MEQERQLTVNEATRELVRWAVDNEITARGRDTAVRRAYAAGIGKSRIAQLTGLARDTVARILREPRP